MSLAFDSQKDFLLPIGAFAERLLAGGISLDIKEKAAAIQAGLIVTEKYLVVPQDLSPDDQRKYKSDALFKAIKEPEQQRQDLDDIVPAGIDIDEEIRLAREIVDAGKGVPNVPPFGQILSRYIPKEVINLCLQVQSGLRVMAIVQKWEAWEKIPEARIFDNDPDGLKMVQHVSNKSRQLMQDGNMDDEIKALAINVSTHAIVDTTDRLRVLNFEEAAASLENYITAQDRGVSYQDAYSLFLNRINGADNPGQPESPRP